MNSSSSPSTLRLIFQDSESNKFWEISINDIDVTVRFGKIGTQGQVQTKSFASNAEAQKHRDKLVAEKRKKGYVDDGVQNQTQVSPGISHEPAQSEHDKVETKSTNHAKVNPEVAEARELFNQWWDAVSTDPSNAEDSGDDKENRLADPNDARPLTLENLAEASRSGWHVTIAQMFTGVSEAKRSSLRKEFLKEHQLYGTLYTSETAPHWKKSTNATKLIDIALGNKQELLYALNAAIGEFPAEVVKILKERPAEWLANAIERHLFSNPFDAFPTWAELISAGILTTSWDDLTIRMIGDSNFRAYARQEIEKYRTRIPELERHLYRLLVSQTSATSDSNGLISIMNVLQERGTLDRVLWIRTALHGYYQAGNQNHTRGCMDVIEHLAPSVDELSQCQGELAAALEQSKPFAFESLFGLLNRFASESKMDWDVLGPALSDVFSRAGIAQAKTAIQILVSGAKTADRVQPLQALCSALLHSKREVTELAWKHLSTLVTSNDHAAVQHIQNMLPHLPDSLRRQIEQSPLFAESVAFSESRDGENEQPQFIIASIEKFPAEVAGCLKLNEMVALLEQQKHIPYAPFRILQAPVLGVQPRLEPIGSLDELVLRLGAASTNGAHVDERELLLDGICRFPGGSDPSFKLKVAAIKKDAVEEDGFVSAEWNSDLAYLIRAWLGLKRPEKPERPARVCMEYIAEHRNVAIEEDVRRGEAIQLLSISTHSGGWIDPSVFLERLEAAEREHRTVFLADLELALLRLAPDGRSTYYRNSTLVERSKKLKGPYALMIRYAMGELVPESLMIGSQRLWVAAIKSLDEEQLISKDLPFGTAFFEDGEPCKLPATAVCERPRWNHSYATLTKAIEDGRGCRVNLIGGDIEHGLVYKPRIVSIGEGVPPAADNYFMTRYLTAQIFDGRFFRPTRRTYWPAQLDWYWYSLVSVYMFFSHKKSDFDDFDDIEPLLERERPLTKCSARILWISSLTRAEKHRLWTSEAWAQLVEDDRLDIPMLVGVLREFKDQDWIVPKRWSEVLTPVAGRSPLHAWEMSKLVFAMLESYAFDAKDVAPFLEIVLEAYTWLGLSPEPHEIEVMRPFATGKSKKIIESILKLPTVNSGEAAVARQQALQARVQKRLERAERFSFSNANN